MSKSKEMFMEEQEKKDRVGDLADADREQIAQYIAYLDALKHKTNLMASDDDENEGDLMEFYVDFSKVQGVSPVTDPNWSAIMLSGQAYVIQTPYEEALSLWSLTR